MGARAGLLMLDAPSYTYLAYRPGVPLTAAVWRAGGLAAARPPGPGRLTGRLLAAGRAGDR